jgi:hypothetical protein
MNNDVITFLAHTNNVHFNTCTTQDELKNMLKKIECERKTNAPLTCVMGPMRSELERQDLRQSNVYVFACSTYMLTVFS